MSTLSAAHVTQRVYGARRRTIAAVVVSGAITALVLAYCPVPWSAVLFVDVSFAGGHGAFLPTVVFAMHS